MRRQISTVIARSTALIGVGLLFGCVEVPFDNVDMPGPPSGHDGGTELGTDGGVSPGGVAWRWESPRPQGNNLHALWGIPGATSAQDTLYAAGDGGSLLIGGSSGWNTVQADTSSSRTILALSGQIVSGQPLIMAVGMFDLALRSQTGQWSDLNPLLGTGDGSLNSVWASPVAGEFFVAGSAGRMYWVRGRGATWLRETPSLTTDWLYGIHGTGSDASMEVYAVGERGRVVHRTPGSMTWSIEADTLIAQQLNAVWCGDGTLAGEVFAVGQSGAALHKKGGNWTSESIPTSQEMLALWGSSDDLFAVGAGGTILYHNAGTWTAEGMGLTDERLAALWGTTHESKPVVYAAGSLGTLLKRERGLWGLVSSRVTTSPLAGIWARNPSEYYAVGSDGTVLQRSGAGAAGTWMPVAMGVTPNSLNAVHGYSTIAGGIPDVYAVGVDGTILHQSSTGSGWAVEGVALTSAELTGVWVGADSVWVVGRGGRIGKKLGATWTPENGPGGNPVMQDLYAVWGTGSGSSQVTYVGGATGMLLRRANNTWAQEGTGLTDQTIVSLFGSDENNLYAFGNKGATLHRTGGQWRAETLRQFTGSASGVAGTTVANTNEMFAVGTQGLILHFTNAAWNTESSLTTLPSSAIAAAASTDVIAVGANGLILHKY